MVDVGSDEEASVFRALADSTRRQILEDLRAGDLTAGEITDRFPISGPSISRHLGVLKAAGLVRERREANRIYYSLVEERLALCVGRFLSVVCPDQAVLRRRERRASGEQS
ncbi:metalloregulator ArsR/SmtB family transcription factor [Nocardia sp. NPDC049149]|uniref:metalloregulator ArsR/SmtB family transcription factor n=1 Tax=Nocardia sp. NPDC049149 TaxID=3364315 RepID=UPI003711DFF2